VFRWADGRAAKVEDKTRAWERLAGQSRAEQSGTADWESRATGSLQVQVGETVSGGGGVSRGVGDGRCLGRAH
jgi:hypothetical protein